MRPHGFTLIEMIVAITITGIVAASIAVFMRTPVESYAATARRAWLTDVADTALRRIARDVQAALPNSLRPLGSGQNLELLPTTTGGRYDHDAAEAAGCFAGGCTGLATLGSAIGANNELVGQRLVVYNLHANDGNDCGANHPSAWCGNNSAPITGSTDSGNNDSFAFANTAFRPSTGSPARVFFVAAGPVAYVCSGVGLQGGNGTGELRRYEGYAVAPTPTFPPPGAAGRLLAHRVSACRFDYNPGVTERNGLLSLYLEITEAGERVALHHQVHVNNAP